MQERIFGNSGLELSVLGIGCWAYGGGDYWGEQSQKDVNEVVHAAVNLGFNYFDTAEAYNGGRSEAALGIAMRDIRREKLVIGSKVNPSNCYEDTLIEHCEASLKCLGTDYLDLYMIHWPLHEQSMEYFTNDQEIIDNPPTPMEAYTALLKLKDEGKIRHIGVSNFSRKRLDDFPSLDPIDVNQVAYNLVSRAAEIETLPFCQEQGIGVIGYSSLMQGILTDAYPNLDDIPANRRRTRHFNSARTDICRHGEPGCEREFLAAMEAIREIASESGFSMRDLAIRWSVAHPAITCSLVGCRNVKQLKENAEVVSQPLSPDLVEALNLATQPVRDALGNHLDYYQSAENDRT